MKFFVKLIAFLLFLLIFVFVSGKLFFESQTNQFLSLLKERYLPQQAVEQMLTIGLSSAFSNLDPLQNEVSIRERLSHIYEGLVRADPFLEIEPALAVSFGTLDDLTWEFRLRRDVTFHDSSALTVDDVLFSLEQAWKNPRSGLMNLLATFDKLERIDEEKFRIHTKSPDPLLLQKLALMYIFPKHATEKMLEKPVGTGPFQFENLDSDGTLRLTASQNYWDEKPFAAKVSLISLVSRDKRKEIFQKGEVDLLANVPPEVIPEIRSSSPMEMITSSTLESNFLLFGFEGPLKEKNLRRAINLTIDREEVTRLAFGFAKPASQFVGKGIFGYSQKIPMAKQDIEIAKELAASSTFVKTGDSKTTKLRIDLPEGFDVLGRFLFERLRRIGLKTEVKFHAPEALEQVILEKESDLFFFGWRATLGDSASLLESVMHSREGEYGSFNGMGYKNEAVDTLIEESGKILDPLARLSKLRQAMAMLVEEDIVGIPLFIPEILYGRKKGLLWEPRIDGYILGQEVKGR